MPIKKSFWKILNKISLHIWEVLIYAPNYSSRPKPAQYLECYKLCSPATPSQSVGTEAIIKRNPRLQSLTPEQPSRGHWPDCCWIDHTTMKDLPYWQTFGINFHCILYSHPIQQYKKSKNLPKVLRGQVPLTKTLCILNNIHYKIYLFKHRGFWEDKNIVNKKINLQYPTQF